MVPSHVDIINGKPLQFYRMGGGLRPNPNSMEYLVPYMVATTYAVLCLLLLRLGRKTWPYYAADLATAIACAALHHFKQSHLSFNLAIAYTVWNLIPGSLATIELPSHTAFMRDLKIKKPSDSPTECLICWEEDQSHGELPCGHEFCLPCIKLMTGGEKFQTTCPTCRRPLFNIAERFQVAGMKGNYTCFVLTLVRAILHLFHETKRHDYVMAGMVCAQIIVMVALPAYLFYKAWSAESLDQITAKPSAKTRNGLRATGIVVSMSVVMVCVNFWSDIPRFG